MPTVTVRPDTVVETRPTMKFGANMVDGSELTFGTLLAPGDGQSAGVRLSGAALSIPAGSTINSVLLRIPCNWFGASVFGNTAKAYFRPAATGPWSLVDSHVYLAAGDFTMLADLTPQLGSYPWDAPQVEILCDEGNPSPPIFPEE